MHTIVSSTQTWEQTGSKSSRWCNAVQRVRHTGAENANLPGRALARLSTSLCIDGIPAAHTHCIVSIHSAGMVPPECCRVHNAWRGVARQHRPFMSFRTFRLPSLYHLFRYVLLLPVRTFTWSHAHACGGICPQHPLVSGSLQAYTCTVSSGAWAGYVSQTSYCMSTIIGVVHNLFGVSVSCIMIMIDCMEGPLQLQARVLEAHDCRLKLQHLHLLCTGAGSDQVVSKNA